MLGTIVMDEQVFPVTGIGLGDAAFMVQARAEGPLHIDAGTHEIRLHDVTGQIVVISRIGQELIEAKEGDYVELQFVLRVIGREAEQM